MSFLQQITIPPLDQTAMHLARIYNDSRLKPLGALGKLEDLAVQIAGITQEIMPRCPTKRMVVFAADNGVLQEGITPVPQAFTASQTVSMTRGLCGINVLCRHTGAELQVVDVGVAQDIQGEGLIHRKVAYGTRNMAQGPAMEEEELLAAMKVGYDMALQAQKDGITLLGVGEMGIGNTSTSSAVLAAFTGEDPERVTGRGAGIDDEGLAKKVAVIRRALEVNAAAMTDTLSVLRCVGGLDIAAMTGCYIGSAQAGLPVVVDGFIAIVAALAAFRLFPEVRDYMIPSHVSQEPGYALAAEALGLMGPLNLDMRLGEGSGCPLMFQIIDSALALHAEMASLEEGSLQEDVLVDIR